MRSRCVPLSLSRSPLLSLSCRFSHLFLLPKRRLRNQFRRRSAALSTRPTNFFSTARERKRETCQVQKYYHVVAKTALFLSQNEIGREYRALLHLPRSRDGFESSFTNFVTRAEGTRRRAAGLALNLYSLRKVRSRPRSLNSIILRNLVSRGRKSTLSPPFPYLSLSLFPFCRDVIVRAD